MVIIYIAYCLLPFAYCLLIFLLKFISQIIEIKINE